MVKTSALVAKALELKRQEESGKTFLEAPLVSDTSAQRFRQPGLQGIFLSRDELLLAVVHGGGVDFHELHQLAAKVR